MGAGAYAGDVALSGPVVAVEAGPVDALVVVDALPGGVEAAVEEGERRGDAGADTGDVSLRRPDAAVGGVCVVDALVVVDALPCGVELAVESGKGWSEACANAGYVALTCPTVGICHRFVLADF